MPKKPPFNHFRKSCRSPSNGNKKEKRNCKCHLFPAKGYACLSHRWMCGEGEQGEQEGCSWWPCQPYVALACVEPASPEDPFLKAGTCMCHWSSCLHPGGFPPCPAMPAGATGATVPAHQRNPLAGHTRSTGSHSVSSIPKSFVSACSVFPAVQCSAVQQLSLTRAT